MRRYFLGVTIVAAFNAIVVGIGALVLDVPLAGTIAVVTFVTAYIPFVGAVVAGAFAVLLALGTKGTTAALIMLVIVILANGLLQNIVAADRDGRDAADEPAAHPRRHDLRRRVLRHGRHGARGAAHVGRDPHLRRPRPRALGRQAHAERRTDGRRRAAGLTHLAMGLQ